MVFLYLHYVMMIITYNEPLKYLCFYAVVSTQLVFYFKKNYNLYIFTKPFKQKQILILVV